MLNKNFFVLKIFKLINVLSFEPQKESTKGAKLLLIALQCETGVARPCAVLHSKSVLSSHPLFLLTLPKIYFSYYSTSPRACFKSANYLFEDIAFLSFWKKKVHSKERKLLPARIAVMAVIRGGASWSSLIIRFASCSFASHPATRLATQGVLSIRRAPYTVP